MPIVIDEIPGVIFTKFEGVQTAGDWEAYIRRYDAIHACGRPYVGINWMKSYSRERAITERVGRWLKETETLTELLCAGAALINTSAAFRFVLSAVFLIKPLVVPYQVCASFADAEAFARKVAPTKKIVLPPRLRCPWPDLGT
jgi:hypothetical protein